MTSDTLLPVSSQYSIRYPSPKPRGGPGAQADENDRPLSRRRDSVGRQVPPPISDYQPRAGAPSISARSYLINPSTPHSLSENSSHTAIAPLWTIRQAPPPNFDVSIDCDPVSTDEEEPTSPRTLQDRYRREIEPPSYDRDTSDEEEAELREAALGQTDFAAQARLLREMRNMRGRRRAEPSIVESSISNSLASAEPASNAGGPEGDEKTGSSNRASDSRPLQRPHARFFIDKDKSVVSIKFDPPVAGKFILVKLWSPYSDTNIDIQSIIAYGYAGPRYFPAESLL